MKFSVKSILLKTDFLSAEKFHYLAKANRWVKIKKTRKNQREVLSASPGGVMDTEKIQ